MTRLQAAPQAPGGLGQAAPAPELLDFLDGLTRWRGERRQELDRIDAASLRARDADSYTSDLALALSMWQAVSDRLDRLTEVWDSGRVTAKGREEMSRLIWGRLDTGPGAAPTGSFGVSLVEAARLCDALTSTLRARLSFDPQAADVAARIAAVRAGLHRCAELVAQGTGEPAAAGRVDELRRRLKHLAGRAAGGADVGGPFAVLEGEAARFERDLIVVAAGRRDLGRDRETAQRLRDALERREGDVRALAERCAGRIAAPPRLAVPNPAALGPVPSDRAALDAYRVRLERVAAAMDVAETAYAAPLAARDELRGRLQAFGAKATAIGRASDPSVGAAYEAARAVLWSAPCDLDEARRLVADYQQLLRSQAQ